MVTEGLQTVEVMHTRVLVVPAETRDLVIHLQARPTSGFETQLVRDMPSARPAPDPVEVRVDRFVRFRREPSVRPAPFGDGRHPGREPSAPEDHVPVPELGGVTSVGSASDAPSLIPLERGGTRGRPRVVPRVGVRAIVRTPAASASFESGPAPVAPARVGRERSLRELATLEFVLPRHDNSVRRGGRGEWELVGSDPISVGHPHLDPGSEPGRSTLSGPFLVHGTFGYSFEVVSSRLTTSPSRGTIRASRRHRVFDRRTEGRSVDPTRPRSHPSTRTDAPRRRRRPRP